jgi:hypothetical protein
MFSAFTRYNSLSFLTQNPHYKIQGSTYILLSKMMLLHKQIFVRLTQVSEVTVTLLQLKTQVAKDHDFTEEKPIHFHSWSKKHYPEHNSSTMVTLYYAENKISSTLSFIIHYILYILALLSCISGNMPQYFIYQRLL